MTTSTPRSRSALASAASAATRRVGLLGEQARADLDDDALGRLQIGARLHGSRSASGLLCPRAAPACAAPRRRRRRRPAPPRTLRRAGQLGLDLLDERAPRERGRPACATSASVRWKASSSAWPRAWRIACSMASRSVRGLAAVERRARRDGACSSDRRACRSGRSASPRRRAARPGSTRPRGATPSCAPPSSTAPRPAACNTREPRRRRQLGHRVAVDVDAAELGEPAHQPGAHLPGEQIVEIGHRHQARRARRAARARG